MTNVIFFAVLLPREKRHDKLRKNEGGGAVGKEGLIDRAVVYVCEQPESVTVGELTIRGRSQANP